MRSAGFTIIELMVSLVVILLIVAGTTAVITYQTRLAAYQVASVNAQQAVETALLLIRNDLLQAGGPLGVRWQNPNLFIKYNGFLNLEAPTGPANNCNVVRSVFCPPDCADNKCGVAWQTVATDGSFTMDRFPLLIGYDVVGLSTAFLGALNLSSDCTTLLGASLVTSATEVAGSDNNINHSLKFVTQTSFAKGSYASPAIVYQLQTNTLRRNGLVILGGDISVTTFKLDPTSTYPNCSVTVEYTWTPPMSFPAVSATQVITVGMLQNYLVRGGG